MITRSLATAVVFALGAAAPAWAADWTVDMDKSRLGFTFVQDGKSIEGAFGEWTADITFDPDALEAASANVTVVIDSIDAGSRSRSRRARGKTWFAEKQHKEATFQTTAFRETGKGAYEADATLTIRGTEQPITLPFTLVFDGDSVTMDGTVTLDRTAFGVGQGDYESGDEIAIEVVVDVDLVATKAE
ncbi:MAG: YceI family protein [Alphaproteobacteria bacterium]